MRTRTTGFMWRLKRVLPALLLAFATNCPNSNHFISDIYFICENPDALESVEGSSVGTYKLNSEIQSVLVLSLGVTTGASLFSEADTKNYSIAYKFTRNGGEERSIEEFRNSKGEEIVQIEDRTVRIRLDRIDCLSDYSIIAYANSKRASFAFSVDSDDSISASFSLHCINDLDDNLDDSSLVFSKLKKEMALQSSCLYALLCKNSKTLGKIEIISSDENCLKVMNGETSAGAIEGNGDGRSLACLVAKGLPNSRIEMTICAGDKKKETFLINLEKSQDRLMPDSPPQLSLIPIRNGYRLVARASSAMLERNFSIMLGINGSDAETKMEDRHFENGKAVGYSMDVTDAGNHTISARYRRGNFVTEKSYITFTLEKDDILQRLDSSKLLTVMNASQSISSFDDNQLVKTVTISLPPLNDRTETIPHSVPSQDFSPYQEISLRVETSMDSVTIKHPDYDWQKGWSESVKIFDEDASKRLVVRMSVSGCLGKAPGDERVFVIDGAEQDYDCALEYSGSYYDGDVPMSMYSLVLDNNTGASSTLCYSYSMDKGRTFSDLRTKPVGTGRQSILLDRPISKGYSENDIIFRARILQTGRKSYSLDTMNASSLSISAGARVDSSDSIQTQPNARMAKITPPSNGKHLISYAVSDGKEEDANKLKFMSISSSGETITVIKADAAVTADTLTKYLWIKTQDAQSADSYPLVRRYPVAIGSAPPAITSGNKSDIWRNEGIFGRGICLFLTSPMDNCRLRAMSCSENTSYDGTFQCSKTGDETLLCSDWDMCMASYRHSRFTVVTFTRKAGYMDSRISEYCGGCRDETGSHNSQVDEYTEKLMKEWRCEYEF